MKAAHTAGTETGSSKHVDEMKGDYPAGTRMKVAHTAGTETGFSKNVDEMKGDHPAGTRMKVAQKRIFPKMLMG